MGQLITSCIHLFIQFLFELEAIYNWLNSLINKNKSEFALWPGINWLNSFNAYEYQNKRDDLLKIIGNNVLFKGTKPYHKHISKGCEICGSGKWSCLFVTNKCNAACFYCPAPQKEDELPSTQGLDFESALDYADYLNHFQFKGVSFSGGEPLLYFNRVLDYLKTVRKLCPSDLYIWMYTNGILADTSKLKQLADAGLNEIRFDIGATGFSLDKVKLAKGIIENITIEIPAIPEEKEKLLSLLPEMIKAGVTNLNLHHLRLTQHNAEKLIKRGYTIINAEKPLVLESELAALEIVNYANEHHLDIGINYCSFHYKNRFQKSGFRSLVNKTILPESLISQNGYIREVDGDSISYKTIKLLNDSTDLKNANWTKINKKVFPYILYTVFTEGNLTTELQKSIQNLMSFEPNTPPEDPLLFKIWQHEYIESGLRDL